MIRVKEKGFQEKILLYLMQKATPPAVKSRSYGRFTFVENTISNLPEVTRAKFLRSNGLFCFISICKFGSLKNPFATITSLSEL